MKDNGDFLIPLDDHFKALRLDDCQRKAAMDILVDADAIVDEDGEKQFSIQAYTEYILIRLDELGRLAQSLQSLDDLKNYESLTRGFLHEWTVIIGNLSFLIAKGCNLDRIDETEITLEGLIGNMRTMFEHLVEANKLFMQFGRAPGDGLTGEKA